MKQRYYIVLLLTLICWQMAAQRPLGGNTGEGGFSLSNLKSSHVEIPDSLLKGDSLSTARITGYRLTRWLGDAYIAPLDTNYLNLSNQSLTEGRSLGVGYLANVGSAAQSLLFNERKESRDFYFVDPFDYYITTPENALFYDTKVPYTDILYGTDFTNQSKADRIKGVMSVNFGKRLNVGFDADYIYSRGFYNSNGNKMLSYRLFGSYKSDRYEAKAHALNYNFVYHENGGLADDRYVTEIDSIDNKRSIDSKSFPTRYQDFFNRVRGKNYLLTHRYNLGFYQTLEETDEEGNDIEVFVPVSSIIHTISYEDNRRHAYADQQTTAVIDTCYDVRFRPDTIAMDDRSSYWQLTNVVGLSLREGFQDWVKFGLTAFVNIQKRQFKVPSLFDERPKGEKIDTRQPMQSPQPDWWAMETIDEFSTFIGAELSKRQGSLLTYNARGELGIAGDDVGEFRLNGELQTRFPLFKKEATIRAEGYIHNVNPSFFYTRNSTRYYQWNNKFDKERRIYLGGAVDLESTRTHLSAGVTNLENYIYFDASGMPVQHKSNIQLITGRIRQDFRYRAIGWENEAAYQFTGDRNILMIPELVAHSNLYFLFKPVPVLTVQLGADVHYFSAYDAPYYEPGNMRFQQQKEDNRKVKVGDYPLINAYANFHLKQARFFVQAYNIGSLFIKPNYFSLAHYPLDPMAIRVGVIATFNN